MLLLYITIEIFYYAADLYFVLDPVFGQSTDIDSSQ